MQQCWRDSEETWNQNDGAPRCLSEGHTGEVSACRACMGEPSPKQVGGDHSDWPGQDPQGAVAEGGNPHLAAQLPPQQGWGTGAAWMLDGSLGSRKAEATRRFRGRTPTQLPVTANDVTHGYKWQVHIVASCFRHEEGQSIWSQCRQGSNPVFKAGIGELPLSHDQASWEALTSSVIIILLQTMPRAALHMHACMLQALSVCVPCLHACSEPMHKKIKML